MVEDFLHEGVWGRLERWIRTKEKGKEDVSDERKK